MPRRSWDTDQIEIDHADGLVSFKSGCVSRDVVLLASFVFSLSLAACSLIQKLKRPEVLTVQAELLGYCSSGLSCRLGRTSCTSQTTLADTPESGFQGRAPSLEADVHEHLRHSVISGWSIFIENVVPDVSSTEYDWLNHGIPNL